MDRHTACSQEAKHRTQSIPAARQHSLGRSIDCGNVHEAAVGPQERRHGRLVGRHHSSGGFAGKLAHEPAALGDKVQGIFQVQDASDASGNIFADSVADDPGGFDAPGPPQLGQGVRHREDGRLGEHGFVQRGYLTGCGVECGQERLGQQGAKQQIAAVDGLTEGGFGCIELTPHPHVPRPFPGEEKRDLRWLRGFQHFLPHAGGSLPRRDLRQAPCDFLARSADDRKPVVEMTAPAIGRVDHVGERLFRVNGEVIGESVRQFPQSFVSFRRQREQMQRAVAGGSQEGIRVRIPCPPQRKVIRSRANLDRSPSRARRRRRPR